VCRHIPPDPLTDARKPDDPEDEHEDEEHDVAGAGARGGVAQRLPWGQRVALHAAAGGGRVVVVVVVVVLLRQPLLPRLGTRVGRPV